MPFEEVRTPSTRTCPTIARSKKGVVIISFRSEIYENLAGGKRSRIYWGTGEDEGLVKIETGLVGTVKVQAPIAPSKRYSIRTTSSPAWLENGTTTTECEIIDSDKSPYGTVVFRAPANIMNTKTS